MYVVAFAEGFYHVLIAAQMGHHAQFYLAVVGREEKASWFGYEGFSYFLAVFSPHGYVLQVGIAR